jgi:hypothetical protein
MDQTLLGKKVKAIYWPRPDGSCTKYPNDEAREAILWIEDDGDCASNWIVEVDKDGQEIRRHNAKYIETIEWLI